MSTTIVTKSEVAFHIRQISPRRVAVAYLGEDWRTFLPDFQALKAIIVAPVLGTNPDALRALVACLSEGGRDGWDRVFFLRNLHAKLYLGASAAVWGSANLSRNGLSGGGLVELCSVSSDKRCLDRLEEFFKETLVAAKRQYKTADAKEQRLLWLESETRRNPSFASAFKPTRAKQFQDFELESADDFYICWCTDDFPKGLDGRDAKPGPEERCYDYAYFHPEDGIVPGKWVLMWHLDVDYTPRVDVAPYWLMVDDVRPNGIHPREPYFYTSVAFQRYKRRKAEQPFELTREVQDLLHRALVEPDLVKPLIQEARIERGSYFSVPLAQRALPKLIERMKALAAQPRLPANPYHQSSGRKVPAPGSSGTGFQPVSPHSAYETVFLFPISQSKGKRKNYYEATRYAWRVRKGLRLRVGAIALGIDAQSSIDAFKIHRWESIPGAENYKFYGSRLPSGHELLERSYSQVIASAPGYWQWGNGLVVQFDGKGHFKFLSGSADKSWRRLNP